MSFWDHLEVLRWMLIRVLAVWTVCMLLGFVFVPYLFEQVVMAPCRDDFFLYQLIKQTTARSWIVPDFMETSFHVEVVNIRLASQFFIHMTLSCWLALLVTFPYLVYEIWRFVCPALYEREKRGVGVAFLFGTLMFFLGCFVGYGLVFPMTLRFLYTYELSPSITNQLSLDSYMDNFLTLIFLMGIIFELPLLSALLSKLGILNRSFFHKYRRHAILVLLIVSAVITPSSDPFTLMLVFMPIYVLWELSALLVRPASDVADSARDPESFSS